VRVWLVAALGAVSVVAVAATPVPVTFPSRDLDPATGRPVELRALLILPERAAGSPVPAVVALHGCGGMYSIVKARRDELSVRHRTMAEQLAADGYAVLFPDSFRTRGREEICTQPLRERRIDAATRRLDALGALAYLQGRGDIAPDRVAVLGWSHGGITTLATMDGRQRAVAAARAAGAPYFRAAVAYYPGCRAALAGRPRYAPASPLLLLVGGRDDWTAPQPCVDLATRLRDAGEPVTIALYADAFHGFDGPDGQRLRLDVPGGVVPGQGVTVASDPSARDDSRARVRAFLRAELGAMRNQQSREE
jgi:dienelactone hydrolase